MIYILLVIIATGGVFLTFRAFETWGVDRFTAIVVNYGVASTLGWTLAGGVPMMKNAYEMPWFITTAIMGAGFLYLFNLMAKCTAVLGVAVASIASKLSLVLPVVVFLIIDPNDIITGLKALALVLALVAIVLSSLGNDSKHLSHSKWAFILPVIIFTGSGGIDLVFAWFSGPEFIPSSEYAMAFTSVPFTVAFILGAGIWFFQNGFSKIPVKKDLLAGLLLGVVNFGSLFFLLGAYGIPGIDKSVIIPVVNIGVVLFSTLCAVAIYKDRPSKVAWSGLAIGCLSIIILMIA
ncbi:MAG: hypothetical protein ACKVHK_02160 [Flavobacteriales bacterium]|jgi:hypothetical protein|tara:strand:- start:70 stop:945 length:876 start_codon:yes stop_codon:yes gene_type:complete